MPGKLKVKVDKDLADIMPGFLKNRAKDIETIKQSLASNDIKSIEVIAHKLAGNAGGYGLHDLGVIGKEMEMAARNNKVDEIEKLFSKMKDYMASLEIEFV